MPNIIDGLSMDIEQTNMDKMKAIFPECFAEGKLDIDKLLSLCGEYIDNDFEKYKFEWKGKAECLKLAQKRSTGTLRPCPEERSQCKVEIKLIVPSVCAVDGTSCSPPSFLPLSLVF